MYFVMDKTGSEERKMSGFKFVPNALAKEMFNLAAAEYVGNGMSPLLETVLGKDNYDRYIVAQDPLCGGKTSGEIRIILNRAERNHTLHRFAAIGTIHRLP